MIELIEKVCKELGYSKQVVQQVYNSPFKFMASTLRDLPLKEEYIDDISKLQMKTSFNFPRFGKFFCIQPFLNKTND